MCGQCVTRDTISPRPFLSFTDQSSFEGPALHSVEEIHIDSELPANRAPAITVHTLHHAPSGDYSCSSTAKKPRTGLYWYAKLGIKIGVGVAKLAALYELGF